MCLRSLTIWRATSNKNHALRYALFLVFRCLLTILKITAKYEKFVVD